MIPAKFWFNHLHTVFIISIRLKCGKFMQDECLRTNDSSSSYGSGELKTTVKKFIKMKLYILFTILNGTQFYKTEDVFCITYLFNEKRNEFYICKN